LIKAKNLIPNSEFSTYISNVSVKIGKKIVKIGQIISLLGIFSDPLLSYGNIKRIDKKHASPRYQSTDLKSLLKPQYHR